MKKFINVSNHPTSKWDETQLQAIMEFEVDEIIDIKFPEVDPTLNSAEVGILALNLFSDIVTHLKDCDSITVHIMGELGLTFYVVQMLKKNPDKITVVHSTTERVVEEKDGIKTSKFKFVRFREYL